MRNCHRIGLLLAVCLLGVAPGARGVPREEQGKARAWTIDGQTREALVFGPSRLDDRGAPVVLVFHGHGGNMRATARLGFQELWPEAIVVCPQGLPTATLRDPKGERAGWQNRPGTHGDRDLKFVDAILETLAKEYKVDDRRIYATGHSNGGGFTYTLGAARGDRFAAIAPSAAGAGLGRAAGTGLRPIPLLHVAGRSDPIVRFENQERLMTAVRRLNQCEAEGRAWDRAGDLVGTIYPSPLGTPFVSLIHPGDHRYPAEAPRLIVRFFQEHERVDRQDRDRLMPRSDGA